MGGKALFVTRLVVGFGFFLGVMLWEYCGFCQGRDPFSLPPGVQKGVAGGRPGSPGAEKAGQADAAVFRVTTILISGPNRVAAVNGILVREGDELRGYRVEAIEDNRVVFKRGKEKMVIHIDSGDKYSFKKTSHDRQLSGSSQ
jgi:hypothetical protein